MLNQRNQSGFRCVYSADEKKLMLRALSEMRKGELGSFFMLLSILSPAVFLYRDRLEEGEFSRFFREAASLLLKLTNEKNLYEPIWIMFESWLMEYYLDQKNGFQKTKGFY